MEILQIHGGQAERSTDDVVVAVELRDGWYYDDELEPTTISTCPFTCNRFLEAANATIEIVFGCTTVQAG